MKEAASATCEIENARVDDALFARNAFPLSILVQSHNLYIIVLSFLSSISIPISQFILLLQINFVC
ncbi:hypothetical protein Lalb_Chr09g0334371 [Lupinus albus]|uniref:Uncharacterized protein n=1 Tax=Lupinus albus TaxID=3870 RepID=A0A6A4Q1L2_LUPAL|nr:hypothetical protein Lalb_Chr09g0334371 [Lupinus albus]